RAEGDINKAIDTACDRVEVGIALHIDDPIDIIEKYKDRIVYIQLMGIDKVGFQGQSFDPKVLDKIKEIEKVYPDFPIQIDGAVDLDTSIKLVKAGADRLVVGSALFNSDNLVDTYRKLEKIS
ncbi:MAG TPA: hypothetical protein VI775_02420, partial [Candidatus Paceibacterota bacterium]